MDTAGKWVHVDKQPWSMRMPCSHVLGCCAGAHVHYYTQPEGVLSTCTAAVYIALPVLDFA